MKRMVFTVLIAVVAWIGLAPASAQQRSAAVMLEAANQKATLEGDLPGAIKICREVVAAFNKTDRTAAATAMLRMADYYEQLRDPQAPKILSEILANYADVTAVAAAAQARMSNSATARMICEDCADPMGSISADGRVMLTVEPYFRNGPGGGDIGVRDLRTGTLTPLQIDGTGQSLVGFAMFPELSRNGRQIAYLWGTSNTTAELRVIGRESKSKARVLLRQEGSPFVGPLGWLSGTSLLAFRAGADRRVELLKVSTTDGVVTPIASLGWRLSPPPGKIIAPSPDGRFIAIEALPADPPAEIPGRAWPWATEQIFVMPAVGGVESAVTSGAGAKRWPIWSADGNFVLYTGDVSGAWDLWAVPVREGKPAGAPILVKKAIGEVRSLGMTSTGVYHYYEGRTGVFRSTIAAVPASGPRASFDAFVGRRPMWSPDGRRVAVNRDRADGSLAVVVRTLATAEERVYTRPRILNLPFMWYPDSRALLVLARDDEGQTWYRLNLDNGQFEKLALQPSGAAGALTLPNVRAFAPDGRTLYVAGILNGSTVQELDRIVALDLSTGATRDLFRLPVERASLPRAAQQFALTISPDGTRLGLLFSDRQLEQTRLATVGVDGQGYLELTQPFKAGNLRNKLVWSRDGQWIYLTTTPASAAVDDDLHRVVRIQAGGGAFQETGIEVEGLESFDVNPDNSRLAYSTLRPEGWGQLLWALDVAAILRSAK